MASNRITVKKDGETLVVTSNHISVKQAFWSWGSFGTGSGKREYPEFYGRDLTDNTERWRNQYRNPDANEWEWRLSEESARHLVAFMHTNLGETPTEIKASKDVIRALDTALAGKQEPLDAFTKAYITAALWSTNDESDPSGGDPIDDNYGPDDIAPDALAKIQSDCQAFLAANQNLISENMTEDQAGHDFWLTRCGHGVGFWDRGLGEVGEKLTEASRAFGECWIEVGDDGQLRGF